MKGLTCKSTIMSVMISAIVETFSPEAWQWVLERPSESMQFTEEHGTIVDLHVSWYYLVLVLSAS